MSVKIKTIIFFTIASFIIFGCVSPGTKTPKKYEKEELKKEMQAASKEMNSILAETK